MEIIYTIFFIGIFFLFFRIIYILYSKKENNTPIKRSDSKSKTYTYIPPLDSGNIYYPTYEDMLLMDKWKEKAKKIRERDRNRCVYCGSTHNLQVHHKYYSRYPNNKRVPPWNYPDEALITLCDRCHKKIHEKHTIKTYYRKYNDNY